MRVSGGLPDLLVEPLGCLANLRARQVASLGQHECQVHGDCIPLGAHLVIAHFLAHCGLLPRHHVEFIFFGRVRITAC